MTIRNFSDLKQASREALDRCENQKQLALVYTGVLVGSSLLLTILDYILSGMIANTGGLSNMGTRSILSSLQAMLPIAQTLVMLGWNAGYTLMILRIIRRRSVDSSTLTSGFSLFFPMLRTMLLESLVYVNIAVFSFLLSSQIYMFTPWFRSLTTIVEPLLPSILGSTAAITVDDATMLGVLDAMIPMLVIFCVLYMVLFIPISYRFRFSTYCLVDAPRAGAIRALAASRKLLRGNCLRLFRMDLRFWWYHGILALASLIQMLPLLGFLLPQGFDFTYYLCYGVYIAIVFALYALVRNRVECTYAAAYDGLLEQPKDNAVVLGNIFDMQ